MPKLLTDASLKALTTGCKRSSIWVASLRMAGVPTKGMSNERLDLIIAFAARNGLPRDCANGFWRRVRQKLH
ncbi:hypothetical protein [Sphingobium sp. AEW001]|uniref:hypothetical protein n=1 Tax=Sphingobium sp. AEW001 TaxID=2572913 RepID=UPI0011A34F3E|nr:hypothetical protein [Sphingobium sp. AEW001]